MCFYRVKNEQRFIRRSLERTWQVCSRVVIFDDGSTDSTRQECIYSIPEVQNFTYRGFEHDDQTFKVFIATGEGKAGAQTLHWIDSPYLRAELRVNEVRDKNAAWAYIKATLNLEYVLALDGDEILSLQAIRRFPEMLAMLDAGVDVISLGFVYLWDREDQQRADALYGNARDGGKRFRQPRLFTTKRLTPDQLKRSGFQNRMNNPAGFHCGSVVSPLAERPPKFVNCEIVHWGYFDDELRRKKYEFYRRLDPSGEGMGHGYDHVIGKSNVLAPGPVMLIPFEDV
jgi:glycosyltransferase involved in cell wall biosynthesis